MADGGYTEKASPKEGAKPTDMQVARKRLQQCIEATNQNRIFQLDDLKFAAASPDNKFQWPDAIVRLREADPNGARPVLTLNKLPQHILQVTNEQRQNRPSIKVSPVDDKADKEVAEVLTGVIRHIEYMSDADMAYAIAGENQVTHGEGYVRVLTEFIDDRSFDQEIVIAPIKNSFSVYMDPIGLQRDPTGRYCEWGFIVEDMSKDEFDREFPKASAINWELTGNGDEWKAWFPDSDTVRVAEYFCYVYEPKKLYLFDVNGTPATQVEGDPLPAGVNVAQKPIKTRTTKIRKVMWQKMNGQEPIETREWAGSCLPLVRIAGNEWYIDGKMVVSGLVRNAKDAQRMFNYWKSTECETLALMPKVPFVGPAEAFEGFETDWQQANTKNLAYLKFNQFTEDGKEITRPERSAPQITPTGIVNAAMGAADDIKSTTGQYDPSLGNNSQARSGVALQREQRKTDMGTFHYIDNQARGIKQLGRILVDLVPKIYDTKRVARILGEDGEADHAILDPDAQEPVQQEPDENGQMQTIYNPTIGRYDVTVSVGPGFASKRQEAADLMAQVLQGNKELMSVMGDLYFSMLDVPGAEEIAKRLKKTLPPGLADSDDEQDQPMVQTPRGPVSVQEAGQIIAQLEQSSTQAHEMLQSKELKAQEKDVLTVQNKSRELDIRRAEVEIERYSAVTERMKVQGAQTLDEAAHALEEAEAFLTHDREAHALNQAAEIHENDNANAQLDREHALSVAASRPKPNGGMAAGAPA